MAAIVWKIRKVKAGVRAQADVVLPCGKKMSEYATGRVESTAKTAVSVILADKVKAHKKKCRDGC